MQTLATAPWYVRRASSPEIWEWDSEWEMITCQNNNCRSGTKDLQEVWQLFLLLTIVERDAWIIMGYEPVETSHDHLSGDDRCVVWRPSDVHGITRWRSMSLCWDGESVIRFGRWCRWCSWRHLLSSAWWLGQAQREREKTWEDLSFKFWAWYVGGPRKTTHDVSSTWR